MVMPRSSTGEGYDYHSYLNGVVNGLPLNGSSLSSDETKVSAGAMARNRSKHYL
jgi:hypothetical protein